MPITDPIRPVAPKIWDLDRAHEQLRKLGQVCEQLQKGLSNNWEKVSLVEDETETEVLVEYATEEMVVIVSAQDAATAAEIAAGTLWGEVQEGKVVIHHVAGSGDRTVGAALFG